MYSGGEINPNMIKRYTNKIFNPSQEHDAHEALRYILSEL